MDLMAVLLQALYILCSVMRTSECWLFCIIVDSMGSISRHQTSY